MFVQARTASQELLGLREAVLALSNPIFSSGIQVTGGGNARDSVMLFPAYFSIPGTLFAPDTCGTYQCSFVTVVKSSYYGPWREHGILCVYLDPSNWFNRTSKINLTLLRSLHICAENVCHCIWSIENGKKFNWETWVLNQTSVNKIYFLLLYDYLLLIWWSSFKKLPDMHQIIHNSCKDLTSIAWEQKALS